MILISLFATINLSFAQSEKSAFEQALEQDSGMTSEESWVDIQGVRYRKIDLRGEHYYLLPKNNPNEATVFCRPPKGADHERVVADSVETQNRTRGFLQGFRESCKAAKGGEKAAIHLGPEMGLQGPATEEAHKTPSKTKTGEEIR